MRLLAIELEEFRGWVRPQRIDLSPSVVIIHGANGTGKTSLFDGVLWALAGELPRLGDEHRRDVVSLYGDSGTCRVRLELADADGLQLSLIRTYDGVRERLKLETGEETLEGPDASRELLLRLWPSGAGEVGDGSMAATLTRAIYLQQDAVRRFIETDSDSERFDAVAELVGAGRYTELQEQIERERTAWNRQSNQRRADAEELRNRVAQLVTQVESLAVRAPSARGWERWRDAVRMLVPTAPLPDEIDALTARGLDEAVRSLNSLSLSSGRRVEQIQQAIDAFTSSRATTSTTAVELRSARSAVRAAERQVHRREQELVLAEKAASEQRDRLRRQAGTRAEMASLAELALRHLGSTCPVCGQSYDRNSTRLRLSRKVRQGATQLDVQPVGVDASSDALRRAESLLTERRQRVRQLEARRDEKQRVAGALERLAKAIGVVPGRGMSASSLRSLLRDAKATANSVERLARTGESFGLVLAQASESRRRRELVRTLATTRKTTDRQFSELGLRDAAATDATRLVEGLRGASDDLVSTRIAALGPVLDRIFARVDPHPGFQAVQLLTRVWHGRGRLSMRLRDVAAGVESPTPHVVLSSSQLNGLALAVFLTLNLGVSRPPLTAAILDDPLQSLDEINLLGVVDLLRRVKELRQVLVSTHDQRLAGLLQRKLRPVEPGQSLGVVRISEWRRDGPVVQQVVIPTGESPWRITAQG